MAADRPLGTSSQNVEALVSPPLRRTLGEFRLGVDGAVLGRYNRKAEVAAPIPQRSERRGRESGDSTLESGVKTNRGKDGSCTEVATGVPAMVPRWALPCRDTSFTSEVAMGSQALRSKRCPAMTARGYLPQ